MNKKLNNLYRYLKSKGYSKQANQVLSITKVSQKAYGGSANKVYEIQSGDSFYTLSNGDPRYQKMIEEANPNVDPSRLQIGQEIILPPRPRYPNQNMKPSLQLYNFIKKYESKPETLEPYLEVYDDGFGNMTVGWGHNLGKSYSKRRISQSEAEQFLRQDVEEAASFLRRNVSVKLTQGQFDALVSIVFNAGTGNVYNSDLFKEINRGNIERAANLIPNSLIGENQRGLMQRRREEAVIFKS